MEKVQISQDALYQFIQNHGIKLVRLAELSGLSEASINSCFKHQIINRGIPRSFTPAACERLSEALGLIANDLRQSVLKFDPERAETNSRGTAYDRGLVEPMKTIGKLLNLTALCERVLGWSKKKKESILVSPASKVYGNISEADAAAINTELLTVAGVLAGYEVVPDKSSSSLSSDNK